MASQLNSRLLSAYRNYSRVAGGIVFAVGFLVLLGWLFDIPAPKSILPSLATMKANTALAFVLAGISLWLAHTKRENQRIDLIARACATLTALIGLLTLTEYIFSWDLGIDQFLFKDALTPESAHPGRMSLVTALNLSLLGISLLLLDRQRYRRLMEVFTVTALLISVLALLGYAYGVPSLYRFYPYSSVAIHTVLTFAILCLGILFARPEQGLMQIFSSDDPGGVMARRLMPAALALPFLLGWLFLAGQRMGLYDSTFRLVLFALSTAIVFAILIWWNADLLQSADVVRQQTQAYLNQSEEREAAILFASLDAVITIDHQGRVLEFNPAAQKIFGYHRDEVLGREMSQLIIPPSLREQHRTGLRKYLATGEGPVLGKRLELTGMRADGTEFPVELTITPIAGSDQPVFTGFVRDITERKRMEETRAQLAAIVESSDAAIIGKTLDGIITSWNEGAEKVYGYIAAEVVGRPISILIPSDLPDELPAILNRIRMGESINHYETARLRKDGQRINVSLTVSPIRDSAGNISGASTIARDITARKQAEEKIAYQAYLLENVNDAVIGSDENAFITFWNQGAERMFGWKAEEVLGRSGREILRSELLNTDRETVLKMLAEQGRSKSEAIQYRKDGTQVIIEVSTITLRDANDLITGYVSVNRDITERKVAEEKIHKQNQRLKVLREIDTAILAADSIESIVGAALGHVRELIDCRRANLTLIDWGTNESVIFDVSTVNETSIPKGKRFPLAQYQDIIQALSQDQLLLMNDLRGLADPRPAIQSLLKDGLQSLCSLPLSSQGNLIGMFSIYSEVPDFFDEEKISLGREVANQIAIAIRQNDLLNTLRDLNMELEQRVSRRTAALSQTNALLQMLLDHMPDHIYFKDAQSRFIRNSRSQARALGLSDPAEIVGKSDFDFFPHAQLSYEKEQEIIRSGKPLIDMEEQVVWPDGRETWVSTTKVPLLDQAGHIIGTFGISRDITDRKQTESALQKAKLELEAANKELEAFSYSVSHDLRAPLRAIDGFSQALLEDYGDQLPEEGQNYLIHVRKGAQRMAELIDDLLNLSKVTRASMKFVSVNLSQLAQGIAAELQRTHGERRMSFNLTPNLKAYGDPNLLQIVLENLLNNAWKYTSKQEQAEIEFGSKRENDETIYFIRDNGAGFDMAYANKLFGAFQRLHAMTEFPGTGIGLATVQRIINRHGGRIWAEGAVGQGATFFFTLPALQRAKPEALPKEKDSLAKRVREII